MQRCRKSVLWKFPPTRPCFAMKKKLKDLASKKRKFKPTKTLKSSHILNIEFSS